jgi:LPS-assembly protein
MPKPKLALLVLGCIAILRSESQIELIAQNVRNESNKTIADQDVTIRMGGKFVRADHLILCRDTGEAELFGNVYVMQPNEDLLLGDYIWLKDGDTDQAKIDHFFTMSSGNGMWLAGNEARIDGNISVIKNGSLSGCAPARPDWSIRFSGAEHNRQTSRVHLYNSVFYAGRFPIFYLPYFGYYTDNKRHSGLLLPSWGHSDEDGALYELPLYLAPFDAWDIEIWQQKRTERGSGAAMIARFVDSPYSRGEITLGRFSDDAKYVREHNIEHLRKEGGSLKYERSRLFTDEQSAHQEGLLIDYQNYSDIEYVRLRSIDPKKKQEEVDYRVANKADYFIKSDDLYFGLYSRHFKDYKVTANNDAIIQVLPEMQAHIFSREFFMKNFLISADLRHRRLDRKEGILANDYALNLPIAFNASLLDGYLRFNSEVLTSLHRINYSRLGGAAVKDGEHYAGAVKTGVSTTLAKPYESFFHTLYASITLSDRIFTKKKGYFDYESFPSLIEDNENRTAELQISQFFFDSKGREVLAHRLIQPATIDSEQELLDMTNEIQISMSGMKLANETVYSHKEGDFASNVSTINFSLGALGIGGTYLYNRPSGSRVTKRYFMGNADLKIDTNNIFRASFQRDLLADENRGWEVAYLYKRNCWEAELSFSREITPYSIAGGTAETKTSDIIFLKVVLIPLGEFGQQIYSNERM